MLEFGHSSIWDANGHHLGGNLPLLEGKTDIFVDSVEEQFPHKEASFMLIIWPM